MNWTLLLLTFLISCITSFIFLPAIKKWIAEKKKLQEDNNKFRKPRVTSLEGLISVLIFFLSISIILVIETLSGNGNFELDLIFTSLLTIALISFLGFIDDILGFPKRVVRNLFLLLSLVPFLATYYNFSIHNRTTSLDYITLFTLIATPFVILITAYSTNAIKSFNKVNLTSGLIIIIALIFIAVFKQSTEALVILTTLGGVFLFLQLFNYTNMKLSFGKVGRLTFGAIIAIAAIFAEAVPVLILLLVPYFYYILRHKRHFDKDQKFLRNQGAKDDSPEHKDDYEEVYMRTTLLQIVCAIAAILIQL